MSRSGDYVLANFWSATKTGGIKFPAVVFLLVFAGSLVGIATQPPGQFSLFWPSNALLLGVFVRFPAAATPFSFASAAVAYLTADLITGSGLLLALVLNAGNLLGVLTGYLLYRQVDEDHRRLQKPFSLPILVLIVMMVSSVSGLAGALSAGLIFDEPAVAGWVFWTAAEITNYMALLPVVLAIPDSPRAAWASLSNREVPKTFHIALPALSLVASAGLALLIGGPGALVFPIPALLWCALTYGIFGTGLLTLTYITWVLVSISWGLLPYLTPDPDEANLLLSLRLGVSFVTFGPITVASVMAARDHLLLQAQRLAEYDPLSGLLNRRAFYDRSIAALGRLHEERRPAAVLMIDIDLFKTVNDAHGHAAGDRVIVEFCNQLDLSIRQRDITGRMGGEEFAVLLTDCHREEAEQVAHRIRRAFSAASIDLDSGQSLQCTASIGVALSQHSGYNFEKLLSCADTALYEAKRDGRDQVVVAGS